MKFLVNCLDVNSGVKYGGVYDNDTAAQAVAMCIDDFPFFKCIAGEMVVSEQP